MASGVLRFQWFPRWQREVSEQEETDVDWINPASPMVTPEQKWGPGPLQYEACNVVRSKVSVANMSTSLQDVNHFSRCCFLSRIYIGLSRFIKAILFEDTSRNVFLDEGLTPWIKPMALMAMTAYALIAAFGLTSISLWQLKLTADSPVGKIQMSSWPKTFVTFLGEMLQWWCYQYQVSSWLSHRGY